MTFLREASVGVVQWVRASPRRAAVSGGQAAGRERPREAPLALLLSRVFDEQRKAGKRERL